MTAASLRDWIGSEETREDRLRPDPARFMQATLDRTPSLEPGDRLPPLWHWLYFLEATPARNLGRDAHPKKGGFLPPVDLPRRMWAGGRVKFNAPLILGHTVMRRSTVKSIEDKTGSTGRLCFVTVLHEVFQNGDLAISEEQDIVYREDPAPDVPTPRPKLAPTIADHSARIIPSAVMLFRYSALTFNGHRIHYDVEYARNVEGYDGLVFHGPLTATLLADLAQEVSAKPLVQFDYRGIAPLTNLVPFDIEVIRDNGGMSLWARGSDNALAMSAQATC